MRMEECNVLKRGDFLNVHFGCGRGHQTAQVQADVVPHSGRVKVRKYLRKSKRWTNPLWIGANEIIGTSMMRISGGLDD